MPLVLALLFDLDPVVALVKSSISMNICIRIRDSASIILLHHYYSIGGSVSICKELVLALILESEIVVV